MMYEINPEIKKPPIPGRLSSAVAMNLRGRLFRRGRPRDERLVITAAVDRRHLRSHGPQIRRQLAAMMNAVVVEESQIQHCRQVEHTEKFTGVSSCSPSTHHAGQCHAASCSGRTRPRLRPSLRLVFGRFHLEVQIGNSIQKLDVRCSRGATPVPCAVRPFGSCL